MEAFEAALDMKADMIEFDVRRTADGALIVHHDAMVGNGLISGMTTEKMDGAASNAGYCIPTLEDVLSLAAGKVDVNMELKEPGYEKQAVRSALEYVDESMLLVSSCVDSSVALVRKEYPGVTTGLIFRYQPLRGLPGEVFPQSRMLNSGAHVLIADWRLLRFGFLARASRLGKPVYLYTVNDRKKMWKYISDKRTGGLFTDRPDVALFLRDLFVLGSRADKGKESA